VAELKQAEVIGRLDQDELEQRTARALRLKYRSEVDGLMADIRVKQPTTPPPVLEVPDTSTDRTFYQMPYPDIITPEVIKRTVQNIVQRPESVHVVWIGQLVAYERPPAGNSVLHISWRDPLNSPRQILAPTFGSTFQESVTDALVLVIEQEKAARVAARAQLWKAEHEALPSMYLPSEGMKMTGEWR
jgi:hypothetical protein